MRNFRLVEAASMTHAEYADAAVVRAGSEIVFLAGACPLDSEGNVIAPGDFIAQTRAALASMDVVLHRCRSTRDDIAFFRVLVVTDSSETLGEVWRTVREHFGDHQPPATLQGASALGYPGQLVEIESVAVRST